MHSGVWTDAGVRWPLLLFVRVVVMVAAVVVVVVAVVVVVVGVAVVVFNDNKRKEGRKEGRKQTGAR